jgi:hypothetical protein
MGKPKNDTEYLAQGEWYFSESQRQLIRISSMEVPYAQNAYAKMEREFGKKFTKSKLADALKWHAAHRELEIRVNGKVL